jgi:hypothetical protein
MSTSTASSRTSYVQWLIESAAQLDLVPAIAPAVESATLVEQHWSALAAAIDADP